MRYKILFISSWFPNKIEPTNGNFVQRHAEAVSILHDVEVLHAIGDSSQVQKYIFEDNMINGLRTLTVYYKSTPNPALNFARRMKAYKKGFSKMRRPDLVHANILQKSMLFAVYLKKKYKIPFVVTEHWSGFLKMNRKKLPRSEFHIAKVIAKNADYLLPVSQFLLKDLKDMRIATKMEVVSNVVNTDLFHVKTSENERFIFLHISNLVDIKNPDKIINATLRLKKEFNNFELHIGGDGDINRLNEIINRNNAKKFIKTFPTLDLNAVAAKMRASECFILFSDYENFPCVLLESLSVGTPVIATNVGGIPEIVNEKNGILISKSEEELYKAMKKVLVNQITFETPENLHQYVEDHFSMETISKNFDEIYGRILR